MTSQRPEIEKSGIGECKIFTSVGGSRARFTLSGEDIGEIWQNRCIESWNGVANRIVSVSEQSPRSKKLEWFKTRQRPSIGKIIALSTRGTASHVVLTNSDICMTEGFNSALAGMNPNTVYAVPRQNVQAMFDQERQIQYASKEYLRLGFDLFVLPPAFLQFLVSEELLHTEFKIGRPWWDYVIPILAIAYGFPYKKYPTDAPIAQHLEHDSKWDSEQWQSVGHYFIALINRISNDNRCVEKAFFESLAKPRRPEIQHLRFIARSVINRIGHQEASI